MTKHHLKFRHIKKDVQDAAEVLFAAKPWGTDLETRQELFTSFLTSASAAYDVPAPSVIVIDNDASLAVEQVRYDLGVISLPKYSVLGLFHGFRHHLQALGTLSGLGTDYAQEQDAIGWACSLYYSVRPFMFRRLVRSRQIRYVKPRDLLRNPYGSQRVAARPTAMDGQLGYETNAALLSVQDVASALGVSTSRVYQLKESLGAVRNGNAWGFDRAVVAQEVLNRGRVLPEGWGTPIDAPSTEDDEPVVTDPESEAIISQGETMQEFASTPNTEGLTAESAAASLGFDSVDEAITAQGSHDDEPQVADLSPAGNALIEEATSGLPNTVAFQVEVEASGFVTRDGALVDDEAVITDPETGETSTVAREDFDAEVHIHPTVEEVSLDTTEEEVAERVEALVTPLDADGGTSSAADAGTAAEDDDSYSLIDVVGEQTATQ